MNQAAYYVKFEYGPDLICLPDFLFVHYRKQQYEAFHLTPLRADMALPGYFVGHETETHPDKPNRITKVRRCVIDSEGAFLGWAS